VTQPSIQPIMPRVVRIVYAALCGGALGAAVVLATVRAAMGSVPAFAPTGVLRYVAIGVFLTAAAVAHVVRGRVTPLAAGADEATWWVANLPQALIIWACTESGVLVGAVIHFLTGDWIPVAVAAAGLFVLWGARPERLLEG